MSDASDRLPVRFFLLVFLWSVPFWLAGEVAGRFPDAIPIPLPLSALMAFVPGGVALYLVDRAGGGGRGWQLLKRAWDVKRVEKPQWLLVALFCFPLVLAAEYALLACRDPSLPAPEIAAPEIFLLFCLFALAAAGEEIGWQGHAFGRLTTRWNALESALVLGLIWGLWHIVPYSQAGHGAWWIFWQVVTSVLLRVLIVWMFCNASRSVAVAVLAHATYNVGVFTLPAQGAAYDPFLTAVLLAPLAAGAVYFWGPGTLARFRYGRP